MKTIIHLRSTFHAGGTENLIVKLFNEPLTKFRIILILMKPGMMMSELKEDKNKVYHIYRRHKIDLKFLFSVIKIVRYEKPFAIHTHQFIELAYACIIKLFFPYIKLYHQIHLHNPVNSFLFRIERLLCLHFVKKIITVSWTLHNYLISNGYPEEKIIVLYNIVTSTSYVTRETKIRFLEKIKYSSGDFLIGMIGNFVREKDQETLARAFKVLLPDNNNTKLVFIGDENNESERCKSIFSAKELADSIFFTGQIINASEYIPLFNLMVLSSKSETFGIAALEPLLYEVPVVASEIQVMTELSDFGRYFDLFPVGDYVFLANLMLKYIKKGTDSERQKIAREYVLEKFSPDSYSKKLERIYGFDEN